MKKKIVLSIFIVLCCCVGFGQSQEIQQLVMDIEKLAQLKSMYQSMVKGYTTLANGYGNVIHVAKGNFDLHKTYLDGLMAVNPSVKKYAGINSITANQVLIAKACSDNYQNCYRSGLFSAAELAEIRAKGKTIVAESVSGLDELLAVLTPGAFRMNDEERIEAIDMVGEAMREHLKAIRKMNDDTHQVLLLRAQKQRDVKAMKILNGKQ